MSPVVDELVPGWTGKIGPYTILSDGTPQDLTNMTVTLVARDKNDIELYRKGIADGLVIEDAVNGIVSFFPEDGTIIKAADSPTNVRLEVVDTNDDKVFFPSLNHEPIVWRIKL